MAPYLDVEQAYYLLYTPHNKLDISFIINKPV
mgnify:CR=1 FL=1